VKAYNKITIWENERRLKLLNAFRKYVNDYFNSVVSAYEGFSYTDGPESHIYRQQINLSIARIREIIHSAGLSTHVYYSPPPAVGGIAGRVDVLANIFGLVRLQMSPENIFDYIDKAIGVYSFDASSARIRTFNPFFWIWQVFEYLGKIPFRILGILGLNSSRVLESTLGHFFHGLISILAALFTILIGLKEMNWLNPIIEYVRNLFL
jgi:hypothetical protein